jgi:demethylmenaquinone methyltransferase/2-methoxy-6-polyprenyl-1,4-benzoquinol methylase
MGYALRHVADLSTAFAEFHRVLTPDGTLVLLEIGQPRTAFGRALLRLYLGRVLPLVSRWTTGKSEAQTLMRYYWDTIENCVDGDTITGAMKTAGFRNVRCDVEYDLFRTYTGWKAS